MFRILALDGGGIKGTFTAAILAELERQTQLRLVDHFDLIVGTSTGGIIAIGLGLGIPAADLLKLYSNRGGEIFPSSGFLGGQRGLLRQLSGPSSINQCCAVFLCNISVPKARPLLVPLVIPTYEALRGRLYLMKTAHHPQHSRDYLADAVDVALATSAAPTYFDAAPFPLRPGESYLDGGLWANSPTMVGIIEAVAFFGVPLEEIDILSVGTTDDVRSFSEMRTAGVLKWNTGLIDVLMRTQGESALAQARLLVGGRLLRIDLSRPPGSYSLDNATRTKIDELAALGASKGSEAAIVSAVKTRFLNGVPPQEYQPTYTLS
ncbi:MAG: patatin-like phospholipase family protein [Devosia sp.]|nr:patatin-like phospholipase family protein [Devosia sp.]